MYLKLTCGKYFTIIMVYCFRSDLGADVSYQAIGEVDSNLETYSVFLNLPRKYKTKDEESSEKEGTNSESSEVFY
jgi:hypothetical protein